MKSLFRIATLAVALGSVPAAQASQTYDFSYKLFDGPVVSGSFVGDANGNLIANLTNITVKLNGASFGSITHNWHWANGAWVVGGGVASLDGTKNNFYFGNASSYFYAIPYYSGVNADAAQVHTPAGYVDFNNGNYNASNWHITAVPEPETYAMMLAGLGLLGVAARRRKQKSAV
jgi:hypothetical protein